MSISRRLITPPDREVVDEHVEHRLLERVGVDALRHREVALGVHVDAQDAVALLGEGRREVQRGGRLGDPALLVGEGDDRGLAGHVVLRSRSGKPIGLACSRPAGRFLRRGWYPRAARAACSAMDRVTAVDQPRAWDAMLRAWAGRDYDAGADRGRRHAAEAEAAAARGVGPWRGSTCCTCSATSASTRSRSRGAARGVVGGLRPPRSKHGRCPPCEVTSSSSRPTRHAASSCKPLRPRLRDDRRDQLDRRPRRLDALGAAPCAAAELLLVDPRRCESADPRVDFPYANEPAAFDGPARTPAPTSTCATDRPVATRSPSRQRRLRRSRSTPRQPRRRSTRAGPLAATTTGATGPTCDPSRHSTDTHTSRPTSHTIIEGEDDFAWRAKRLVVEVDGATTAPRRASRTTANATSCSPSPGAVLRFTWTQVTTRPGWVAVGAGAQTRLRGSTALEVDRAYPFPRRR